MHKLFKGIACAAMSGAVICGMLGIAACGKKDNDNGHDEWTTYSVYAPDGAPALALAGLIADPTPVSPYKFETTIVKADVIRTCVTGEDPAADFCVLPVNLAATLLGTGESYQMLGTVTNGNMYFLTTGDNPALTTENLSTLVGKSVGVVQLNNVPGLTLQAVLGDAGLSYTVMGNDNTVDPAKVNLRAFADATTVAADAGCDYYLCPEPAVSAKIKGSASSPKPFKLAGDLQQLHGGGYPQAVIVAKNSVIGTDAVKAMTDSLKAGEEFLKTAKAEDILAALQQAYANGLAPSFNAQNLTSGVIANCSVHFTASKDCKDDVNAFLQELISVNSSFTKTVSDSFFYMG